MISQVLFSALLATLSIYVSANKSIVAWLKLAAFMVFSVCAIFVWWQTGAIDLANWFGIGRGVDLFIYLAIIGLSFLLLSTQGKFRKLERTMTDLARHIAIREAAHGKGRPKDIR